jgi:hypothetical protein
MVLYMSRAVVMCTAGAWAANSRSLSWQWSQPEISRTETTTPCLDVIGKLMSNHQLMTVLEIRRAPVCLQPLAAWHAHAVALEEK